MHTIKNKATVLPCNTQLFCVSINRWKIICHYMFCPDFLYCQDFDVND